MAAYLFAFRSSDNPARSVRGEMGTDMAQYYLYNYGLNNTGNYNFSWDIIKDTSSVVITAAEGRGFLEDGQFIISNQSPERFIGDAQFTIHNIAPYNGGVAFRLEIDWPSLLDVWVCITVFDNDDFRGQSA